MRLMMLLLLLLLPSFAAAQPVAPDPTDLMRTQLEGEAPAESEWATTFRSNVVDVLAHHHRHIVFEKCSVNLCIIEADVVAGERPSSGATIDSVLGLATDSLSLVTEMSASGRLTIFAKAVP